MTVKAASARPIRQPLYIARRLIAGVEPASGGPNARRILAGANRTHCRDRSAALRREPDSSPRRHKKRRSRGLLIRVARRLAAITAIACALALLPASAEARSPSNALIHKINVFRKAHGVHPLTGSGSLGRTARSYSRRLMHRNYFGHGRPITASRRLFRRVGEALELHRSHQAQASLAVRRWKHSPAHRRLLLSPAFTFIGAGRTAGTFRGRAATIWVVQVGDR